jgi:hypothetical protein
VKPQAHFEKAERLMATVGMLEPERDWEVIIETCYGIAIHLIAVICQRRLNEHRDTHKGLTDFLDQRGQKDIAVLFRKIDAIRIGRWYGGRKNGEAAKEALSVVNRLKERLKDEDRGQSTG